MVKLKKLIIIGAGGHSKTCLEVVQSSKIYKVIGFIDNKTKFDDFFKKFKIFSENKLNIVLKITKNVHIGIGQIKSPKLRINLFIPEQLLRLSSKPCFDKLLLSFLLKDISLETLPIVISKYPFVI